METPRAPWSTRRSWIGLRWISFLSVSLALLLFGGCQQFVILGYLIGGPPSIEPDFDKETGISLQGKDKTVAVVCFAPRELLAEFPGIDKEISAHVSYQLAEHKIAIVKARLRTSLDRVAPKMGTGRRDRPRVQAGLCDRD